MYICALHLIRYSSSYFLQHITSEYYCIIGTYIQYLGTIFLLILYYNIKYCTRVSLQRPEKSCGTTRTRQNCYFFFFINPLLNISHKNIISHLCVPLHLIRIVQRRFTYTVPDPIYYERNNFIFSISMCRFIANYIEGNTVFACFSIM
jgi:hypothetical protein